MGPRTNLNGESNMQTIYNEVDQICPYWAQLVTFYTIQLFITGTIKNLYQANACLLKQGIYHLHKTNVSLAEIKHKMDTYYKFMVVRNPLERIDSFHRDKLKTNTLWYTKNMGNRMIQLYRNNATLEDIKAGRGARMKELVQYINAGYINEHWYALDRCLPCTVHFDHIVRLDTFNVDALEVIGHLEGRGIDTHINKKELSPDWDQFGVVLESFANVSDAHLQTLVQKYRRDFQMFGYNFTRQNGILKTLCSIQINSTSSCC